MGGGAYLGFMSEKKSSSVTTFVAICFLGSNPGDVVGSSFRALCSVDATVGGAALTFCSFNPLVAVSSALVSTFV